MEHNTTPQRSNLDWMIAELTAGRDPFIHGTIVLELMMCVPATSPTHVLTFEWRHGVVERECYDDGDQRIRELLRLYYGFRNDE